MVSRRLVKGIFLFVLLLFSCFSCFSVLADVSPKGPVSVTPVVITGDAEGLSFPYGVAYSYKTGALIIADTQNHRILSLDLKTQKISVIAGITKGEDRFGFPGGGYIDGDLAEAMFNHPRGVAVAENGIILVADTGNHAIRQIADGKVSTIAGGEQAGYQDGQGTKASFLSPSALVVDTEGNIYVSDTLNDVIRKIDTKANVSTYAGKKGDKSLLNEPSGLAIDQKANLYVADSANHQIKKITGKNKLELIAGSYSEIDGESGYWLGGYQDGNQKDALFNFPKGIALKEDGTIFVSDSYNHYIRSIKDGVVSTIAGAGVSGDDFDRNYISLFDGPTGIFFAESKLFVADRWNNRIVSIPDENDLLSPKTVIEPREGEIIVFLDGQEVVFPDIKPQIINDHIKIPIRPIAEQWGAKVEWNQEKMLVTILKGDKMVDLLLELKDFVIQKERSLVGLEILQEKLNFDLESVEEINVILMNSK